MYVFLVHISSSHNNSCALLRFFKNQNSNVVQNHVKCIITIPVYLGAVILGKSLWFWSHVMCFIALSISLNWRSLSDKVVINYGLFLIMCSLSFSKGQKVRVGGMTHLPANGPCIAHIVFLAVYFCSELLIKATKCGYHLLVGFS